jgi:hypothetical protein
VFTGGNPIFPIRSDEDLTQAHWRLDELIVAQAYDSPSRDVRDEFEALTALIYYYEQRTRKAGEFA